MAKWQRRKLYAVSNQIDKRKGHSRCRPRASLLRNWMPSDTQKARAILERIADGTTGVVSANIMSLLGGDGVWPIKLMSKEIGKAVVGRVDTLGERKRAVASACTLSSCLLARCYEEAAAIAAVDGTPALDVMAHHGSSQAAGFPCSKGTGVACTADGHALLRRAARALQQRLP